ncbi:MAG: DMT family transporter [Saprospiraceae bacterium]|nr:DMT family transporter [Saprospiraceae bacterium]
MGKKENYNYLYIHFAVVLFGLSGVLGKLVEPLSPRLLVLSRTVLASLFLACILFYKKEPILKLFRQSSIPFVIIGGVLAFHWVAFFQSIQMASVTIGVLTFSTFPVFTAFLAPLFFRGEKLGGLDLFFALISILGVYLIFPLQGVDGSVIWGTIWGLLSGFSFAVLSLLNKKYVKEYSADIISFFQNSIAAIFLLPFLWIDPIEYHSNTLIYILILGVLCTGVAHTLFIQGMRTVKVQTASLIAALEPVYGIILAQLLVENASPITLQKIIGGGLIFCVSVLMVIIEQKNKK